MYIVDASIALKWLMPEEDSHQAIAFGIQNPGKMHAPSFILAEVTNTLWQKVKVKRFSFKEAEQRLKEFTEMPLELHSSEKLALPTLRLAQEIAADAIYDCLYFTLAEDLGATLITADRKFVARLPARRRKHAITLQQWWDNHLQ